MSRNPFADVRHSNGSSVTLSDNESQSGERSLIGENVSDSRQPMYPPRRADPFLEAMNHHNNRASDDGALAFLESRQRLRPSGSESTLFDRTRQAIPNQPKQQQSGRYNVVGPRMPDHSIGMGDCLKPAQSFQNSSNTLLHRGTALDKSQFSSRNTSRHDMGSIDSRPQSYRSVSSSSEQNLTVGTHQDEDTQLLASIYQPSDDGSMELKVGVNEKEEDDAYHDPSVDYPDRQVKIDLRRTAANIGFLLILVIGAVGIFIVWPVLVFSGNTLQDIKNRQQKEVLTTETFDHLKNAKLTLIDPATPHGAYTKKGFDGSDLKLVFSDEFDTEGRSFYEGDDPYWTAQDIWYGATGDLEWYTPDAATTAQGRLKITFDYFKNHNLSFRSAMMQSWNKLCFRGGLIEISASLPDPPDHRGLWPGLWTLGNLARPGYLATSDGIWPYSYSACDAGITPNQSNPMGINWLPGQRLPSCVCKGEDHPSPGTGRGAPEIDILEGQIAEIKNNDASYMVGVISQSLQTAPMDDFWMANFDYTSINNYSVTNVNGWPGGPFQQCVSGVTYLNHDWYGDRGFQTYGFQYQPGEEDGFIHWFVGDDRTYSLYGPSVGPNGNVDWRIITNEPLSIIMNLGMSNSWTFIEWQDLKYPTHMSIDYVRIYQDGKSKDSLTCDPKDHPTYNYIQDHLNAYTNPNLTKWEAAGYKKPKNKLMDGC